MPGYRPMVTNAGSPMNHRSSRSRSRHPRNRPTHSSAPPQPELRHQPRPPQSPRRPPNSSTNRAAQSANAARHDPAPQEACERLSSKTPHHTLPCRAHSPSDLDRSVFNRIRRSAFPNAYAPRRNRIKRTTSNDKQPGGNPSPRNRRLGTNVRQKTKSRVIEDLNTTLAVW